METLNRTYKSYNYDIQCPPPSLEGELMETKESKSKDVPFGPTTFA